MLILLFLLNFLLLKPSKKIIKYESFYMNHRIEKMADFLPTNLVQVR